jgi:hypothetical protein
MRFFSLLALVCGCSTPLGGSEDAPADKQTAAPPPVLSGCALFGGHRGGARSVGDLWMLGDRGAKVQGDACAARPETFKLFEGEGHFRALAAHGDYLYFARSETAPLEPFGVKLVGYGVAKKTGATYKEVAMLWTANRPAYGDAVHEENGTLYLWGCKPGGFLRQDCYVARVPVDKIEIDAAYTYYEGGGNWSARADGAWPIATGGPTVAVKKTGARFTMLYVTPLGKTLHVRTGLAPHGPWSEETEVASCDLPSGAFCGDAAFHADGRISYSIGSFEPDVAPAERYATRLAALSLPP